MWLGGTRHDSVASQRQRHLARLLLKVDVVLAVVSVVIAAIADWHPGITSTQWLVFGVVGGIAVLNLALAADARSWMLDDTRGLVMGAQGGTAKPDDRFVVRYRHVFYYPGVILHYCALAVLVEITGGFAASPFITLFVALVLTAQQLARFSTQARWTIAVGVLLTLGMLGYEQVFDPRAPAEIPESLDLVFIILSLLTGGAITLIEKGRNYMLPAYEHKPSHAHVYRDGTGLWHVALYRGHHRLDPVLPGASSNGIADVLQGLEDLIQSMAVVAGWGEPEYDRPTAEASDFVVNIAFTA